MRMNKIGLLTVIFSLLILVSIAVAVDFDLTKQDSGIITGLEGNVLTLTVDGNNEIDMKLDRVGSTRVMVSLNSGSNVLVLDIGQEKRVDLDKDGVDDIDIILNNVIDKLASFRIEKLDIVVEEVVVDDVVVDEVMEDDEVDEVMEDDEEEVNFATNLQSQISSYSKWVIGIVVVVVIIILIFVFRDDKNSEKYYNKAMDLHKEGQEFHWDGDDETAEELYDRAGELRDKAKDIEGGF